MCANDVAFILWQREAVVFTWVTEIGTKDQTCKVQFKIARWHIVNIEKQRLQYTTKLCVSYQYA